MKIDALIGNTLKVEYGVYYNFTPYNLTKLDLSVCSDIKIDISIPIDLPSDNLDKFNITSALYNDICYSMSTETGTDQPLKDRQDEFVNNNISVCEEGCEFSEYNNETKRAKCSCYTKLELPLISEIKIDKKKMFANFKDIKNILNINLLKCVNLLLDKKNLFKNTGNFIAMFLLLLSIITLFVYLCKNKENIK